MTNTLFGAAFAIVIMGSPALAAEQVFQGDFDPMPHDNSGRDNVVGGGEVRATLSGNVLSLAGNFSGLSSPAIGAHLNRGLAMGVPGAAVAVLDVTKAEQGTVSGTVKLGPDALAALKRGAFYVELDSKAAPDGNSWSWLQVQDDRNAADGRQ
jgi:hypothetical protein